MSQLIFTNKYDAPPLQTDEILRYMRCKDDDAEINELIRSCLDEMLPQLSYKVCWRELPLADTRQSGDAHKQNTLDLGFVTTDSADIKRSLCGCTKLILFAATVGLAPDRLITRYGKLSPAKALCFQAIAAERIESLCELFCAEIAMKYKAQGFLARQRYSPGYGDFPLSVQPAVFRALDCSRRIGLSLNDSLLMSPSKSVTALMGLAPTNTSDKNASASDDSHLCDKSHKCRECEKTDCLFRQVQ